MRMQQEMLVQSEQREQVKRNKMAKKIFKYRGKTLEELQEMDIQEFAKLVPSRQRRTLTRGFTEMQKRLLIKVERARRGEYKKQIKTHCRNMLVIPTMANMTIYVHSGRKFEMIVIQPEMIGHYLGEFSQTRNKVAHSAPGIGATKSSASVSVK